MKHKRAFGTSTANILHKLQREKNPVTRWSYREILGNRMDRLELFRLHTLEKKKDE